MCEGPIFAQYAMTTQFSEIQRSGIFIEEQPPNCSVFSGGAIPTPTQIGGFCRAAGKDGLNCCRFFYKYAAPLELGRRD